MITCKEDLVNTYIENEDGVLRDVYVSLLSIFDFKWAEGQKADKYKNLEDFIMVDFDSDIGTRSKRLFFDTERQGIKQLTLTDLLPLSYENTKVYSLDEDVIRKYAELCGVEYKHRHTGKEEVGVCNVNNQGFVYTFIVGSVVDIGVKFTTLTPEQILAAWDLKFNEPSTETLQSALDKSQLKVMELTEQLAEMKGVKPLRTKVEYVVNRKSIFDLKDDLKRGLLFLRCEDAYHKIHTPAQLCEEWNNAPIYRRTEVEIDWEKEVAIFISDNAIEAPEINDGFDFEVDGEALTKESFIKMCHLVAELTDKPQ